jgi:dipeptidyl aminopeptidase/acylaminoacyl peptidase
VTRIILCIVGVLCGCLPAPAGPPKQRLLIAFASYRDRPKHPKVYLYEHDGVSSGKVIDSIETVQNRSDYRPSLSRDGRYCAFASELENQTSRILVWDFRDKKLLTLPTLNDSPNAQLDPTLSGDGRLLVFAAWNRPGAGPRWDLVSYDLADKKVLVWPGVNTAPSDERTPSLSADGKWLAFVSNRKGGAGLNDIYLYSVADKKLVPLPGLNSPSAEITPTLSGDGRLIAFASDRPGGKGGRDIYLYDRTTGKLLDLPGLNSAAHEQTPALSPDGRYIVFVSERVSGMGERDIFLYDRQTGKLLPTPGLNSRAEDIDPCITVVSARE